MLNPVKTAVLVSGGGTNLQALIDAAAAGSLKSAALSLVVADKETAYALERAKRAGIPAAVVVRKGATQEAFEEKLSALLEENGFIVRRRSENDRRLLQVYPTEKMEQALPVVRACFRSWRDSLTEGMSEEEINTLEQLLARLAERAEGLQ